MNSAFCTVHFYLKDTTRGRLHVARHDLLKFCSPGDLLLMDQGRIHSVTKLARDEENQVLVFTMQETLDENSWLFLLYSLPCYYIPRITYTELSVLYNRLIYKSIIVLSHS